ncbi:MAG: hypothetical protein LBB08_00590 [Rickettsiales bacterium]|jgi:hypothetical protein|nr:hypothetical protein [Rickettsiales bacterium]
MKKWRILVFAAVLTPARAALIINGTEVSGSGTIKHNGTELTNIAYNGTIVWEATAPLPLPPTISLPNCTYNIPATSLSAATACLGSSNTSGHWQLISTYTGAAGDRKIKKAGSVPPGIYRVESNNRDSNYRLGSLILLTDKVMYYGHLDAPEQTTSRLALSIKHSYGIGDQENGAGCNWQFSASISCHAQPALSISLADNDGTVDWISGPTISGITADNTETPIGASAIYRWVN